MFRKLASVALICSAAYAHSAVYNFSGKADNVSGSTFSGKLTLNAADFYIGSSSHGIYNLTGLLSVTLDGTTYSQALTTGDVWNDLEIKTSFVDRVTVNADSLHLTFQADGSKANLPTVLTSTDWPGAFAAHDWTRIRFAGPFSGTVTSFAAVPEPTGLLPLLVGVAALRRRKNRR